ncbi:MAG: DUF885 domain-containing protein [Terricaulis sp.]
MTRSKDLIVAGLALLLAACGQQRPAPMSAFEGRVADWTQEVLADSPELASQAGVGTEVAGGPYAAKLDDRSSRALIARRSAALRRYVELRGVDQTRLNAGDVLTYRILESQFAAAAAGAEFDYGDFSPIGGVKPYVLNQLDSAFITLPSFLDERTSIATVADAENYLARLAQVDDALEQETARARADSERGIVPPLFIVDATIALLDAVIATPTPAQPYVANFRLKIDTQIAAESNSAQRDTLAKARPGLLARAEQIVRTQTMPAHEHAANFLRSVRSQAGDDPSVSRLPRGGEFYAAALAINTTSALTPDQIHAIGLERVTALTNQLDIALRRVGFTDGAVGERLAQMTADSRYRYPDTDAGRAQLLADVEGRLQGVLARAREWFGRLPRAKLEVRRVPAFAEAGQPGAYYSPPSMSGDAPGIYYVNLRDLGEMTRIDLPTQDFHEAVPGHHFQTALAQELDSAPLLRRLISFNAYSEGWGLYAEELADELNFYDGDPIGRIGFLRWQLWRAARLVVDTGLHAKNWPRQQAIDYLRQTTGDGFGVIATEVDRYVVWPGQACGYELGRREIMRLREKARGELGPAFDLRAFHDAVLLHGELPLNVLDQVVEEWIGRARR